MKKTLLALAGALLLLLLVMSVKTCADRARNREQFVFDTLKIGEVASFEVRFGDETSKLVKKDWTWTLAADGFPADSARVRNALRALLRTRAAETVSESRDPARLAEFGLNEGAAKRVRWTLASGEEYTLLLGKASGADYSSTYWKWEDEKEVYRTPGNYTHLFPVRDADWKSRAVLPFFLYEDIASVSVSWIDSTGETVHYRIDRSSDTSARLVEPFESALPRRSAASVYIQSPQFAVDGLVEPGEDPSSMGLDTPKVKIEVTLKNTTVHRLEAGNATPDGFRYARLPKTGHPVKIFEWRFQFFRKTVDALLHPPAQAPDTPEDPVDTLDASSFEPHHH